jgi:hypothetical protein
MDQATDTLAVRVQPAADAPVDQVHALDVQVELAPSPDADDDDDADDAPP